MRRISAQKFYARVNDNGAYIIDPSQHNYNPEWPEIHVRAISERDYRLMRAVVKAAEAGCRSWRSKAAIPMRPLLDAIDALNAPEKGRR